MLKRTQSSLLTLVLIFGLVCPPSLVAEQGLQFREESGGRGSEFISSDQPKSVLMQVTVIGAIGKPGVHWVPVNTDLITFVALAGGISPNNKSLMSIKRKVRGEYQNYVVDLEDVFESGDAIPILRNGDIIHVPQYLGVISEDVMRTLSVISTVLSLTITLIFFAERI